MIWTLLAPSYGRPRGPLLYSEGGKKAFLLAENLHDYTDPPHSVWLWRLLCLLKVHYARILGCIHQLRCCFCGLMTPYGVNEGFLDCWQINHTCKMPLVPNETESNSQIKLCLLLFSTTLWKWSLPVPILYFVNKSTCISEILGRWCK